MEHQLIQVDGTLGWTFSRAVPLLDGQGDITAWFGTATNITQRKRVEEALRESEEKYRGLFNSMDEGYFLCDVIFDENDQPIDIQYLEANPAAIRLAGRDFSGRFLRDIDPNYEDYWYEIIGHVAHTGESVRAEHYAESHQRWFDFYAFKVGEPESRRVASVFQDTTERKRRELNSALLVEIGQDLSLLSAPDEIMEAVGARLGQFLQASSCIFADVDEAKNEATIHHGWNTADVPSHKQTFRLADYFGEEFARAGRADETVIVRDTARDERANAEAYARLKLGSFVSVPFQRQGRWTANITVTTGAPRDWRPDEIELLQEIANRVFPRIDRARAEEALRVSEEKYRALFDSMDEAFAVVEVMADENGQWNNFLFLDANPAFIEHTTMPYPVGKTATQLLGTPNPRWVQVYGQVIETGEPVRLEEVEPTLGRVFDLNIFRLGGEGSRRVAVLFTNITQRKEAEAERERLLRETQLARADADLERRRLLAVLEQLPVGVHVAEAPSGRLVFDNAAVRAICGEAPFSPNSSDYSRHYKGHYPLGHAREGEPLASDEWPLSRALATGQPATEELVEIRRADGTRRMASISAVPIRDTAGNVEGAVATSVDVTEMKRAEEALRESEEKYRTLFDSMDEGYCIIEMIYDEAGQAIDWRFLQVNHAFELNNGLRNAEGKTIRELAPEIEPKWMGIYDRVAQTGEPLRFEEDSRALGRVFTLYAFRIGAPHERKVAVIFTDITHGKQAEQALTESRARFQAIANLVPDLLWSNDPAGATHWYNQQWLDYTGMRFEELINYGWLDAIHPDDQDTSLYNFQNAVDRGEPLRQEHRIRRTDGQYHWFLVQAQPLRDESGQIIHWFGAATDIHDLKSAQQAVQESEERLRIAIEAGELATWDWDVERDEVHWNERHFLLFGMTPREGVTHESDFSSHIHPDDYNLVMTRLGTAVENAGSFEAEFRIIREDNGEVRWMNGYGRTTESREGRAKRMVGVMFDTTERHHAQEILQRSHEDLEKRVEERTRELKQALQQIRAEIEQRRQLEAARNDLMRRIVNTQEEERGRISRELHDNLGQHLTAIMFGLGALESQIHAVTGGKRKEEVPQLDTLRAQVDSLMRVSHDQARQLRPAELDAMGLEAALGQYIRDWSFRTELEVDFQTFGWQERPSIEIETTLYRVVQEALTNVARHAGATLVSVILERTDNTASAIVEDNGRGFDTEQPTNRLGVLGMKERLDLVGGSLEIESIPGEGTTVFARIPLPSNTTENN